MNRREVLFKNTAIHPIINDKQFIDWQNEKEGWDWDEFYHYTAWSGLDKTDTFIEKSAIDPEFKSKYNRIFNDFKTYSTKSINGIE